MIQVKFKNLDKSDLVIGAAIERTQSLVDKFGELKESKIQVTLEMLNSPTQAGPDLFRVKLHIFRGRYDGVTIEKSDANLYAALAEVMDHMLEVLNRFGDKARVLERKKARALAQHQAEEWNLPDKKIS